MNRLSTGNLLALTVALDVIIVGAALPLERFALQAAHESAPIPVLLAFLAANLGLLGLIAIAMCINGTLLGRIAKIAVGSSRHR